jgi:hypothetical protein
MYLSVCTVVFVYMFHSFKAYPISCVILTNLWIHGMYICMYCVCVRARARMHVHMRACKGLIVHSRSQDMNTFMLCIGSVD